MPGDGAAANDAAHFRGPRAVILMHAKREERAFRTTTVVAAFGYIAQGLSLIALPWLLSALGAESYGLMVTVLAFTGYLGLADGGLGWGALVLIAQANGSTDEVRIAAIMRHGALLALGSTLVLGVAVSGLMVASSAGWRLPMFARTPEADWLILIAAVQLAVTFQAALVYNLFQGLQVGYWAGVYQGIGRLGGVIGAMAAAWITRSVEAVMLVQLACTAGSGCLATLHAWRSYRWAFRRGSWSDQAIYAALFRLGGKNLMLQVGRTLGGTAPILAISAVMGPAMVPLFTVPTTLLALFFLPITSWNATMQSAYGEAWISGAREWVSEAFRRSLERGLIVASLGVILFLTLGDGFIGLWTQDRLHLEPATGLAISALALCTAGIAAGQYLLTGLNRNRDAALAELASGMLALGIVVFGVKQFGIAGAAWGAVLALLGTSAWVLGRDLSRELGPQWRPSLPMIARVVVAAAATGAVILVLSRFAPRETLGGWAALLAGGGGGVATFLVMAWKLRLVDGRDFVTAARWFRLRTSIL